MCPPPRLGRDPTFDPCRLRTLPRAARACSRASGLSPTAESGSPLLRKRHVGVSILSARGRVCRRRRAGSGRERAYHGRHPPRAVVHRFPSHPPDHPAAGGSGLVGAATPAAARVVARRARELRQRFVTAAGRTLDIVVAIAGLALCGLVLLVLGPMIKLGSRGPVFFAQSRIARRGRTFRMYKLRSMVVGAGGPPVTAEGDPRITSRGRFIRKWKVDDLPQVWNVLRGDMTLIGPRPEAPEIVASYSTAQAEILEARPGLASMAQLVYPHESKLLGRFPDARRAYVELLLPKKLAVDLAYERRRTFQSDVGLMFRLARMVLGMSRPGDRSLHACRAGHLSQARCPRAASCPLAEAHARGARPLPEEPRRDQLRA